MYWIDSIFKNHFIEIFSNVSIVLIKIINYGPIFMTLCVNTNNNNNPIIISISISDIYSKNIAYLEE